MITTRVMILLIVAASFSVIRYIIHMEEEKSFTEQSSQRKWYLI